MKFLKYKEQYIKEVRESKGIKILFDDLCIESFGGDYEMMVDWLNKNWTYKKVYFLSRDYNEIYKNGKSFFIVIRYATRGNGDIILYMKDGQIGMSGGLICFDDIKMPKSKYRKIKNIELDPFGEEDWWEKIKKNGL
jgi:hypothetical protein